MTWSTSSVFVAYVHDSLTRTAAFSPTADTLRAAIYNNTTAPDNTVTAANSAYAVGQWVVGNEQSNGGWAAGGVAIGSVTVANSTNVCTMDAADTANSTSATLANCFGALVYDDTLTTPVANQGICFNYFGGSNSVTAGIFTIVWNASGIFAATCT